MPRSSRNNSFVPVFGLKGVRYRVRLAAMEAAAGKPLKRLGRPRRAPAQNVEGDEETGAVEGSGEKRDEGEGNEGENGEDDEEGSGEEGEDGEGGHAGEDSEDRGAVDEGEDDEDDDKDEEEDEEDEEGDEDEEESEADEQGETEEGHGDAMDVDAADVEMMVGLLLSTVPDIPESEHHAYGSFTSCPKQTFDPRQYTTPGCHVSNPPGIYEIHVVVLSWS
jgi:hypothetical protein